MFKFLHAADIHLDSPLRGLERYEGAPVERIRGATRRALEKLVLLALEEKVDGVLLVGDLYDGDWRDFNTGLFLVRQMARLNEAGIRVFLLAGNHDAANRMTRSLALPENVKLFSSKNPETFVLEDQGIALHGQSFSNPAVFDDLSQNYPAPIKGSFNIGLLHTCATCTDHERYAPCTIDGLRLKGYDYWALGHIHKRQELHSDPPIVFPGNLQGRHIREEGPKGCMLVTIKNGHLADKEFRDLGAVRWQRLSIVVGPTDGPDDILDRAREAMRKLLEEPDPSLFAVRIQVQGSCKGHGALQARAEHYIGQLRAQALDLDADRLWLEKIVFATTPDSASLAQRLEGPIEELVNLLNQIRQDAKQLQELAEPLADLKRKLPFELTQAGAGLDPTDPAWLHGLLDQVEPLLLQRLLFPEGAA